MPATGRQFGADVLVQGMITFLSGRSYSPQIDDLRTTALRDLQTLQGRLDDSGRKATTRASLEALRDGLESQPDLQRDYEATCTAVDQIFVD